MWSTYNNMLIQNVYKVTQNLKIFLQAGDKLKDETLVITFCWQWFVSTCPLWEECFGRLVLWWPSP